MKPISRSAGRSVTAAAAYRAASRIHDLRTDRTHNYTAKRGVVSSIILAPSRAPDWARDPEQLWNQVEQTEKRKDARLARENIVALPHELDIESNKKWLHQFVNDNYVKRGMVAQISIHAPDHQSDDRNIHAHILLTDRQITRNGFKAKKTRVWNDKSTLMAWREAFAESQNQALEQHGHQARVDHRSYKERGIDREPTQHLGPAANQIEREDKQSDIGRKNRLTEIYNRNLHDMKNLARKLEAEIAAHEKKKFEAELESQKEKQAAQRRKQAQVAAKLREVQKDDVEGRYVEDDPGGLRAKFDKESALSGKHRRQELRLEDELKELYSREEAEKKLAETQKQLKAAGNLWGRLTGRQGQLKEDVEGLRKNLENIRMREQERRDSLKKAQEAERLEAFGPPVPEVKRDFNRAKNDNVETRKVVEAKPEPLVAKRPEPIAQNELKPLPGYQGPMQPDYGKEEEEKQALIAAKKEQVLRQMKQGQERSRGRQRG